MAEKFQAMVVLGRANSRMKDFYDIWLLIGTHDLAPERLARMISATFIGGARRSRPRSRTRSARSSHWTKRNGGNGRRSSKALRLSPGSLEDVVRDLREFLMPAVDAAMHFPSGQRPKIG